MTIPTIKVKPIVAVPVGLAAGAGLGWLIAAKMIKGQGKHAVMYAVIGAVVLGGIGYAVADKTA